MRESAAEKEARGYRSHVVVSSLAGCIRQDLVLDPPRVSSRARLVWLVRTVSPSDSWGIGDRFAYGDLYSTEVVPFQASVLILVHGLARAAAN